MQNVLFRPQVWLQGRWWSLIKRWTTPSGPSSNKLFWVRSSLGARSWMREWPTSFCNAPQKFLTSQLLLETPCAPTTSMKVLSIFFFSDIYNSLWVVLCSSYPHESLLASLYRSRQTWRSSLLFLSWGKTGVSEESLRGWSEEYWNGVHGLCRHVQSLWP